MLLKRIADFLRVLQSALAACVVAMVVLAGAATADEAAPAQECRIYKVQALTKPAEITCAGSAGHLRQRVRCREQGFFCEAGRGPSSPKVQQTLLETRSTRLRLTWRMPRSILANPSCRHRRDRCGFGFRMSCRGGRAGIDFVDRYWPGWPL